MTARTQKPQWESEPWLEEPGANSPALEPAGKGIYGGIIKTMPEIGLRTLAGELPALEEDISNKNEIYLEINGGWIQYRWLLILASPFFLAMLPGSIILTGWMAAEMHGSERAFFVLSGFFLIAASFYLSYPAFFMAFAAYENEPFRFSRHDRKLYWFRAPRRKWPGYEPIPQFGKPEIKVYDWDNIRAEVTRHMVSTGNTAGRYSYLQLAIVDPVTGKVTERFRIGSNSVGGLFGTRIALWETIRRFMEERPDAVPDAVDKVRRVTLIDFLDRFNPLSRFTQATTGKMRILGYVAACLTLPLAPLLIPVSVSQWLALRTSRRVDWGDLATTVFKLPLDTKPKVNLVQAKFETDTPRRRRFALAWLCVLLLETILLAWWTRLIPHHWLAI